MYQSPTMDGLAALSLAVADSAATDLSVADSCRFDDCGTCDWLRTEAADDAIAVSESPHCALAVALNATTSTAKAATLSPERLWIALSIPMLLFFSATFCRFMNILLCDEFFDHCIYTTIAVARDFH